MSCLCTAWLIIKWSSGVAVLGHTQTFRFFFFLKVNYYGMHKWNIMTDGKVKCHLFNLCMMD